MGTWNDIQTWIGTNWIVIAGTAWWYLALTHTIRLVRRDHKRSEVDFLFYLGGMTLGATATGILTSRIISTIGDNSYNDNLFGNIVGLIVGLALLGGGIHKVRDEQELRSDRTTPT